MSFQEFSEEVFKLIVNLENGTRRIAEIVSNLRTLVKAEIGGQLRRPCDIKKIVNRVEAIFRREIKNDDNTFEVHCPDDLPEVMTDADALEQILINLLINAAHAADKAESWITLSVAPLKNSLLKISVKDNGAGMDDQTLQQIFDPFFTTKAPGLGTGLGLSVCHTLINAMQGVLTVFSKPQAGTIFNIELPVQVADCSDSSHDQFSGPLTDRSILSTTG